MNDSYYLLEGYKEGFLEIYLPLINVWLMVSRKGFPLIFEVMETKPL